MLPYSVRRTCHAMLHGATLPKHLMSDGFPSRNSRDAAQRFRTLCGRFAHGMLVAWSGLQGLDRRNGEMLLLPIAYDVIGTSFFEFVNISDFSFARVGSYDIE